ncbi:hypothetical protein [Anaerobaca lacustris]|uniref:Lactococcin 972 family bacteriocin n=1 Tax=Anaerobaca lacustris TaxID=3044600 RepID=A0AAW6TZU0_9BACT|nr:hypothetical protein [Sedimentisphaerales bacterium M17dextr]
MVKKALFITVVLLIVSTVAFGGYSKGTSQYQSTSVVVGQGTTICGTGVASSSTWAGASGYQVAATPKTTTAQAANSSVKSSSFLSVLWGKASTYFCAAVNTFQFQTAK